MYRWVSFHSRSSGDEKTRPSTPPGRSKEVDKERAEVGNARREIHCERHCGRRVCSAIATVSIVRAPGVSAGRYESCPRLSHTGVARLDKEGADSVASSHLPLSFALRSLGWGGLVTPLPRGRSPCLCHAGPVKRGATCRRKREMSAALAF